MALYLNAIRLKRMRSGIPSRCLRNYMELQPQAGLPLGRELADQLLELVTISTGKRRTLFPVPAVQAYLASMSMPMFASPPMTECGWKTSSQTTTTRGGVGFLPVTITLAVHPWHGEIVEVLQSYGDRAVCVEGEAGDRRIVPVSWTSMIPHLSHGLAGAGTIRICPQAALELSRWVSARLDRK